MEFLLYILLSIYFIQISKKILYISQKTNKKRFKIEKSIKKTT
jgi:hypothetical protein